VDKAATVTFFAPNPDTTLEYTQLADNVHQSGKLGTVLLVVSTDRLDQSKGDLYVALGLAKYLSRLGWGIMLWPASRWGEETPEGIDYAIVMIESFVPGLVHPDTRLIAWVRNWVDKWCELPYLDVFSAVWCSSELSAARLGECYDGPIEVVPLATDTEIFSPVDVERIADVVTTTNFWGVGRELVSALSELSASESITWFGKNAKHLQIPGTIDHRHTIDYFALPGVYSHWQFVIDDVIEAAAKYGNHNSRLFDALACEALVITNTAVGLAELGLGEVPVYSSEAPLPGIIAELKADAASARTTAGRLSAIVRSQHSWEVRAGVVSATLVAGLSRQSRKAQNPELLRWATHIREALRKSDDQLGTLRQYHDGLLEQHAELTADRDRLRARAIELTDELNLPIQRRIARRLKPTTGR
jgi:hypothetical protein